MTLTDRDRKIAMVLVPLALLVGMYFLVLKPKLAEVSAAGEELTSQEQRRDAALDKVRQLESAKTSFAADYAEVVRLGKAIPSDADLPSLLVQLDKAAGGSDVDFDTVRVGERGAGAAGGAQPASGGSGGSGGSQPNAASGGAPAQSGPGQAAEGANETKDDADAKSAESEQQGEGSDGASEGGDSSSSEGGDSSSAPSGGAAAPGGPGASGGASAVPGLETVPLEFEFKGSFFDLVKLTHRVKRFVHLANDKLKVSGRLITIDSLTFKTDEDDPGKLDAELSATVYLTPAAQGVAAGASPQGPAGATPAATGAASGGAAPGGAAPGGPPPGGQAPGGPPTAPVTQ